MRPTWGPQRPAKPVEDWHLSIQLPDTVLPVQLHMKADGSEAWFVNGAEKVMVPEVSKDGDLWRLHFSTFNNTVMLKQQDRRLLGTLTVVRRGYEQVMEVSGFRIQFSVFAWVSGSNSHIITRRRMI